GRRPIPTGHAEHLGRISGGFQTDKISDGLHPGSARTRMFDAAESSARTASTAIRLPAPSIAPASVTRRGAREAVNSGRSVCPSRFGTKLPKGDLYTSVSTIERKEIKPSARYRLSIAGSRAAANWAGTV